MSKGNVVSIDVPSTDVLPSESSQIHYGVGKIKSVFCKDFVTYEECTFYPTEYLNIIIGPNGTGKSTLVAAIILGLGGDPKLLSRASCIQDYIKNGKKTAHILVKIAAAEEGKFTVFQRSISENGKSEFKVNDAIVSRSNFLKIVGDFKIQINNLCQFLPQDRVQDFTRMNPQEILTNTIISVCSQDIIDDFGKLKELRKNQLNGKKTLENNLQKLRESVTRREELKQILERHNTRKQYLDKLEICGAKKLWLEVKDIENKIADINKDLTDAQKSLDERKKTYDGAMKNQEEIIKERNQLTEDARKANDRTKSMVDQKNKINQEIEELKKTIREAKTNLEKRKHEWNERHNEIRHEATMLEVIVEDLKIATAALGQDSERASKIRSLQEQLEQFKADIKTNIQKRSEINKRLDEEFSSEIQMLKKSIDRSKNVAAQKLELLRNNFPDVHKAVLWLEENKNLFEGTIYNPMLLELNVPDSRNAKYFENTIPLRDLLSFVCENKSDVSTLVNELCIKQKLSINVAHSPPATECRFRPNEPITNLQTFGFTAYLVDLVDGPPAVLNYLCSLFKLHSIPIGTEHVSKHTDSIPTHIRQYFGGDQRYNVSVSKYSKEPSLMQARIQGRSLLLGYDMNKVQSLQHRLNQLLKTSDFLKNERTAIESKINELEFQCQEVNNKRRAVESAVTRFNQLKEQCKRQERKISHLRANITSVSDMENECKQTVQQQLSQIIRLQGEKIMILRCYQGAIATRKLAEAFVQVHKVQTEDFTNTINEISESLKQSKKVVETVKTALENTKKKCQVITVQALNSTKNCRPSDASFPYTEMFEELPNELEELKEVMNDLAARLDCIADVDQEIVNEYERRNADIEILEKSISDNIHSEKDITAEITSIYTIWYPQISRVVDILNENFGKFMDSMSYVGEVLLTKKEDFDFDSYGIQIMVQYRKNVPLQALDRHVQSGGERAVAIAVYTLSLQHITHVPFRCVDEINQGMDARNERKIFEMLVEETTKTGRSQYFFVTPKLLPNLKDHERMTVHIVFNGKMVQPNNAFSPAI